MKGPRTRRHLMNDIFFLRCINVIDEALALTVLLHCNSLMFKKTRALRVVRNIFKSCLLCLCVYICVCMCLSAGFIKH